MVLNERIDWFNRDFRQAVEKLERKRKLEPVIRKRPRKGHGPRI